MPPPERPYTSGDSDRFAASGDRNRPGAAGDSADNPVRQRVEDLEQDRLREALKGYDRAEEQLVGLPLSANRTRLRGVARDFGRAVVQLRRIDAEASGVLDLAAPGIPRDENYWQHKEAVLARIERNRGNLGSSSVAGADAVNRTAQQEAERAMEQAGRAFAEADERLRNTRQEAREMVEQATAAARQKQEQAAGEIPGGPALEEMRAQRGANATIEQAQAEAARRIEAAEQAWDEAFAKLDQVWDEAFARRDQAWEKTYSDVAAASERHSYSLTREGALLMLKEAAASQRALRRERGETPAMLADGVISEEELGNQLRENE